MEFELTATNCGLILLALINVITFLVYGWDKLCAIKDMWRVPEKVLLLLALFGGSIGAIIAMQIFRHKTKHAKFIYGVPAIILLQIAAIVAVVYLLKEKNLI